MACFLLEDGERGQHREQLAVYLYIQVGFRKNSSRKERLSLGAMERLGLLRYTHSSCRDKPHSKCRDRKPNCNGYGSICYDPRLIGGDGTMLSFHGAKGGDFALVSDDDLRINAHFICSRPEGRTRDFTWGQALAVMFDSHTLVITAKRVAVWDDNADAMVLRYDGKEITVSTGGEAEWRTETDDSSNEREREREREVVIERTDELNSVKVTVSGLLELDVKVTPIGEDENRTHGYRLPTGDAFAHLETRFKFKKLSDRVGGALGQTYRPDHVSPVKKGVPMSMMGGEDRYRTIGFISANCRSCRFRPEGPRMVDEGGSFDVLVQQ